MADGSHWKIIRISSIVGGASVVTILLSIVRMKVAAVTLGPVGVGVLGIFQNFVTMGAGVATLGIGTSAARVIAANRSERGSEGEADSRRALLVAAWFLTIASAIVLYLLRNEIAGVLLGDRRLSDQFSWLSLCVAAAVMVWCQTGLLTGLQKAPDTARVNIISSLLTTAIAVPAFLFLPSSSVKIVMLGYAGASLFVSSFYALRAPRPVSDSLTRESVLRSLDNLRDMVSLGVSMTFASLLSLGSLLFVRSRIGISEGPVELGYFQASWAIGSLYLTMILQAMALEFFPRISSQLRDKSALNQSILEQTEISILLGGPIILAMLGAAPLVIHILYGVKFAPAVSILHWQLLGDIFKVASFPLSYALQAQNRRLTFLSAEAITAGIFSLASWLLLPLFGTSGAGIAYAMMYLVYLPLTYFLVRRSTNISWTRAIKLDFLLLIGLAGLALAVSAKTEFAGLLMGILLSSIFAARSWFRLRPLLLPGRWGEKSPVAPANPN